MLHYCTLYTLLNNILLLVDTSAFFHRNAFVSSSNMKQNNFNITFLVKYDCVKFEKKHVPNNDVSLKPPAYLNSHKPNNLIVM